MSMKPLCAYARKIMMSLQVVAVVATGAVLWPAHSLSAYEVWLTDQSDTAKESGGYLYIYDGAQLAANPAAAKPTATIDLSGQINTFCEAATKKPVRRPHMLFFNSSASR